MNRAWARLMQACGGLSAVIVGLLVVMVCWDVVARNIGAKSLPWILEVTEYALPLATFLAAPWLMHRNEHVRLDLLANTLSPRNLARIDRTASTVCFVVSAIIVWYSVAVIVDARQVSALVMKTLVFPEWWLFVPVPICFTLLSLECLRRVLFPAPVHEPASEAGLPVPGEREEGAR